MNTTPSTMAEERSAHRWLVLVIILVVQFQLKAIVFAPAALASPIIASLQLTRIDFGLIMSAVSITMMICVAVGSLLVDRVGLKRALLWGLAVAALGATLQLGVHSLRFFIFTRVLQGIGVAVSLPVLGGLSMAWFSKRERPYINTIVVAFGFLGTAAATIEATELFRRFHGSWTSALGCFGFCLAATAIIWLFIGRNVPEIGSDGEKTAAVLTVKKQNSLSVVLALPITWMLGLGIFATSWILQMYLSFVPLFLQGRSTSLMNANRLASLLPFSGVAGVIVFGVLSTRSALRKHLLWMGSVVVILGSIPLFWGGSALTKVGLLVAGFGLSGFVPVAVTYMMSLPSMTPPLLAALVVVENVVAGMSGVISPLAVGRVSQSSFGLRNTLALFSCIELVAVFAFSRLPTIDGREVSGVERTSASSTAAG